MTDVTPNYSFNLTHFDVSTWHDAEHDNWRSVDAVLASFFGTTGFTGVWSLSNAYTVGQIAVDTVDGKTYEVLVGHTSAASGTFSADRLAFPANWQVWLLSHAGDKNNPHENPNENIIINGNFDIWQRGVTFTSITSNYTADRFKWTEVGPGVVTITRSTEVPDEQSDFSLRVNVTTPDASPIAAGDNYKILYPIEGYDAQIFGAGTANVQRAVLSFWVRSSVSGIHCVAFRNAANDRSFISEYTVAVADVWQYITFGVTLDANLASTWLTDNSSGIRISFALAVGSTFQTPAGIWTAGNFHASANQVNVMGTVSNDFHLARVKLEVGLDDTPFVRRPFAQELALCQRYYQKSFNQSQAPVQNSGATAGSAQYNAHTASTVRGGVAVTFAAMMRAAPTPTFYNPAAANALWRNSTTGPQDSGAAMQLAVGESGMRIENAQAAGDLVGDRISIHWAVTAELT